MRCRDPRYHRCVWHSFGLRVMGLANAVLVWLVGSPVAWACALHFDPKAEEAVEAERRERLEEWVRAGVPPSPTSCASAATSTTRRGPGGADGPGALSPAGDLRGVCPSTRGRRGLSRLGGVRGGGVASRQRGSAWGQGGARRVVESRAAADPGGPVRGPRSGRKSRSGGSSIAASAPSRRCSIDRTTTS